MVKHPFLLLFLTLLSFFTAGAEEPLECNKITVKVPPAFVVPTGYSARQNKDATSIDPITKKVVPRNANYVEGNVGSSSPGVGGKRFIVPKRSLVLVGAGYKKIIERTGDFSESRGNEWVPVKVISLPPENDKLLGAGPKAIKNVSKPQDTRNMVEAEVGSVGYLKVADLEKVEKQQDYVFTVKRDSELFTQLNDYLNSKNYKALQPFALVLKEIICTKDDPPECTSGYVANQCCKRGSNECMNYPVFEVLNVVDKNNRAVEIDRAIECEQCFFNFGASVVPIEDYTLSSIRSILAHPTLGLPKGSNGLKEIASIANLKFVDSRGLVEIPLTGSGEKKTGPFNSLHYQPESGDADVYLQPDVACGFMQFLKAWDKVCGGKDACQIEFGDASHAYYKGCTTRENERGEKVCANPWPHTEHTTGECMDINTDRMADKYLAPMVNMLKKLGNDSCFSNEPSLKKAGCSGLAGHSTHMHMCFPSNRDYSDKRLMPNPKLKEACEKGVSP